MHDGPYPASHIVTCRLYMCSVTRLSRLAYGATARQDECTVQSRLRIRTYIFSQFSRIFHTNSHDSYFTHFTGCRNEARTTTTRARGRAWKNVSVAKPRPIKTDSHRNSCSRFSNTIFCLYCSKEMYPAGRRRTDRRGRGHGETWVILVALDSIKAHIRHVYTFRSHVARNTRLSCRLFL